MYIRTERVHAKTFQAMPRAVFVDLPVYTFVTTPEARLLISLVRSAVIEETSPHPLHNATALLAFLRDLAGEDLFGKPVTSCIPRDSRHDPTHASGIGWRFDRQTVGPCWPA